MDMSKAGVMRLIAVSTTSKPNSSMLREDTKQLWDAVKVKPELHGFVLVGGSGLALRIGHRRSEDLDFMCHMGICPEKR